MGITNTLSTVLWSAASTLSVTSATEVVSDAFTVDATTVSIGIQLSADNAGTPASGDTAVFRIRWSTDGGTTYDTAEHAQLLITLDTFTTNTPGEDPAKRSVYVEPIGTHFKVACICAQAATRNVTIAALVREQRAA